MYKNIQQENILQLVKSIGAPNKYQKRDYVVAELKKMHKNELFPILATLMVESEIETRANIIDIAFLIDKPEGIKLALPVLDNLEDDIRYHVCGLMHDFGNEQVIEALLKVLQQDSDPQIRGAAAYALGGIGSIHAIPALAFAEQYDHEYDWSGHSPSDTAQQAISDILKNQIVNHVTQKSGQMINQSFADGSELIGQIIYLPNNPPYLDAKRSDNPYRDLPDELFEPTASRYIESTSLHSFPFAVEIMFTHPTCKIERAFVFSYQNSEWVIETILKK